MRTKTLLLVACIFLLEINCTAGEIIAFSLNSARAKILSHKASSSIYELSGINRPFCVLVDERSGDIILVGEKTPNEPEIKLEYFISALRAIYNDTTWPMVSIDKTDSTYITNRQAVRFLGGINDAEFGKILLDADIALKNIGLGKNLKIFDVQSYFDLLKEYWYKSNASNTVNSRFWFKTSDPVFINRNGVSILDQLKIIIDKEVMSSTNENISDVSAEFASNLSTHYDDLSLYYPEIQRLNILFRFVGLAYGLKSMTDQYKMKASLDYWLNDFSIPKVSNLKTYPLISKEELLSKDGRSVTLSIDGGIDTRMLVSDLLDGSADALKRIVFGMRPDSTSLTWVIPLEGWTIPGYSVIPIVDNSIGEKIVSKLPPKIGFSTSVNIKAPRPPEQNKLKKPRDEYPAPHFPPPPPPMPVFKNDEHRPDPPGSLTVKGQGNMNSFTQAPYRNATKPPNIGGVYLSNVAEVKDDMRSNSGRGNFSFIFNGKNPVLNKDEYKQFCTSLWAVYFDPTPPGISIDPIDPSVDVHLVRYIGNVINTDLGRVMREADYTMKKWAVGTEKPDIHGFRDVDEIMASSHINYFGASRRFWFVPENMQFTAGDNFFYFNGGRMTLKTEYIFLDNKTQKAEPSDLAFANFFTGNYDSIAARHMIYRELFDYAKNVSLGSYIKKNKVPLLWFLLANKHFVLTENSPGTVQQLTKGSKYFEGTTISGGVDLATPAGKYVYDKKAVSAITKAVASYQQQTAQLGQQVSVQRTNEPVEVEFFDRTVTFLNDYALTTGTDMLGNKYQTDLSLWYGNEPGMEIVRISNTNLAHSHSFGRGWRFLTPYSMEIIKRDTVEFGNYIIKKYCMVKNLITGLNDTLVFSADKYNYAGYIPVDSSRSDFILLIPFMNGSFELSDKLGNTFKFNADGMMSEMILGNQRKEQFEITIENCDPETNPKIPMWLTFSDKKVKVGGYMIVEQITLHTKENEKTTEQSFIVDEEGRYISFKPAKNTISNYEEITILSDQSFLLTDKAGGKISFDKFGCITKKVSGFDYKVNYEYFDGGIDRFDDIPLTMVASNERVTAGDLTLPKKMILNNKNSGDTESFIFSDTSQYIVYYPKSVGGMFSSIRFLNNGHFCAIDSLGNNVYFDSSGTFSSIAPAVQKTDYLKSLSQGDYSAEFVYQLLPDNSPVVSKIFVYKTLERQVLYTINYTYDEAGFLVESNTLLAGNTSK